MASSSLSETSQNKGLLGSLLPWLSALDPGWIADPIDVSVRLDADFVSTRATLDRLDIDPEDLRELVAEKTDEPQKTSIASAAAGAKKRNNLGVAPLVDSDEEMEDELEEETEEDNQASDQQPRFYRTVVKPQFANDLQQVLTNGDSAKGCARLMPHGNRTIWHGRVTLTLESFLVHFEPATVRPLLRKQVQLAEPGYLSEPKDIRFDFGVYVGLKDGQLIESFEGTYCAVRHSMSLNIERPWYSFDIVREIPFEVQICFEEPESREVLDIVTEKVTKKELMENEEYQDIENREELADSLENDADVAELEYEVALEPEEAHAIQRQHVESIAISQGKSTRRGPIMTIASTGFICIFDFEKDAFPLTGQLHATLTFKFAVHPIVRVRLAIVREESGSMMGSRSVEIFSDYILDALKYDSKEEETSESTSASGRGKDGSRSSSQSAHMPVWDTGTREITLDLSRLQNIFPTIVGVSPMKAARRASRSEGATHGGASAPEVDEGTTEDEEFSRSIGEHQDGSPRSFVKRNVPKMVRRFLGKQSEVSGGDNIGEVEDLMNDRDEEEEEEENTEESDSDAAPKFSMKKPASARYFLELQVSTHVDGYTVPNSIYNQAFEHVAKAIATEQLQKEGKEYPTETEVEHAVSDEVRRRTQEVMDNIPKGTYSNRHQIYFYRDVVEGFYASEAVADRVEQALEAELASAAYEDAAESKERRAMLDRASSFTDEDEAEAEASDLSQAAGLKVRPPSSPVASDSLPRPHRSNSQSKKGPSSSNSAEATSGRSNLRTSSFRSQEGFS